jgi:hypothetical protein
MAALPEIGSSGKQLERLRGRKLELVREPILPYDQKLPVKKTTQGLARRVAL